MRDSEIASRILVVELWNIGDVVLMIPFLAQLRAVYPRATITLLGKPHARLLLENTALVDDFIETDLAWSRKKGFSAADYRWGEFRRVVFELRRRKFDIGFSNRGHARENLLLAFSGARRRIGYADGITSKLLTDVLVRPKPGRHKADDWCGLLGPLARAPEAGIPVLVVSESEKRRAEEFFLANRVSTADILVGIHPGASVPEKRWPLHRFREVAHALASRPGVRTLAFIDPKGYGTELGEEGGVITAQADLRGMMALLERCDVLVCNDSGPMHIAGALGVHTVAVFGSGIAPLFAPLGNAHELVTASDEDPSGESMDGTARPYDVSEVPTSRVLAATDRALREIAAESRPPRQARILHSDGRDR